MSKISSMMGTGLRSMQNSQTALQTVSHNIANKSTEGYSRQRVELVANTPVSEGGLQIGTGAKAAKVTRTNNPWLEKQIQKENTELGYSEGKATAMESVQNVFNEQDNKRLNQYITDFFNSYRELSNNPESLATRTMVKENAHALAQDFKRVSGQLEGIRKDLDFQMVNQVEEINQISKEISSLNEKILQIEVRGAPANDERDRRELLLKKLGEKIEVSWSEGADGKVAVTAGNTAILISGGTYSELKAKSGDQSGRIRILYSANENGSLFDVTEQIKGGRLGGVLEVRDQVIKSQLEKVDTLAYNFAKEVNRIHIEGFDRQGNPGVLFFDMPEEIDKASEKMAVNKTILNDVGRIAAGNKPKAPGDNTIALMISALQNRGVLNSGSDSFDDFYNTIVGQIGTLTQRSVKTFESQKNILTQLSNIRESISGVNLDEETAKMIEMQKSYEAAARMIKTADELLDTVLNLKRI